MNDFALKMQITDTRCLACTRPLVDAKSAEIGLGPVCRQKYGYEADNIDEDARQEANQILQDIRNNVYDKASIFGALQRLAALGFEKLAQSIEERFGLIQTTLDRTALVIDEPEVELPHQELQRVVATANPQPKYTPTDDQSRALEMVQRLVKQRGYGVAFIVGFAGVGKTTVIRMIADQITTPHVITPTGKAALRVREATGLYAETIHRWIYEPVVDPNTGLVVFRRKPHDKMITRGVVILDEASMVSPDVWRDIYDVVKRHDLKLVCIGDGFQLPPIQPPGSPPFSLLEPEFAQRYHAERVEMTQVLRQAEDSPVVRASMLLRNGAGADAFQCLPRVPPEWLFHVATETYKNLGVVICHRNATRYKLNATIRYHLGIQDEHPRPGEPLLVMKNIYALDVFNGESIPFPGFDLPPAGYTDIVDGDRTELGQYGIVKFLDPVTHDPSWTTICVDELYGRLRSTTGAISYAGSKYASVNGLIGQRTPHLHANFGYCYTGHKSQGSQWPYVLTILESSVRLNEEDGRRWAYTAITRAQKQTAIYYGNV